VIDQVRRLETLRIDAVVVTAPFYANPSSDEIATHFRAVHDATETPVVAYDIPGNVGRRIPLEVALELLESGVIVGLKDSSGSVDEFALLIEALGRERTASLMTGADVLASRALDLGADGLIPGLANARPAFFTKLLAAHASGDHAAAEAYQRAITALNVIFGIGQDYGLGRHASEIGALKFLLWKAGVIATTAVSRPMTPYPAEAARALEDHVRRLEERLD
jgi:4-hydroxy-tetrahydrodipicolinate synthase